MSEFRQNCRPRPKGVHQQPVFGLPAFISSEQLCSETITCKTSLKLGFHSNARNARKALRKEKYASKIKSVQETQQTQENYASKKTKVRKRKSRNGPCARKRNMIESILFFTQRTQRMRAFEWKPILKHINVKCNDSNALMKAVQAELL